MLFRMGTSIAGAQAPELLNAKGVSLTAVSDEGSAPRPRKLLKKFDQNFYIGAPAAQYVTGAAHFNSHIKMGSGDNIPSEGVG